MILQILDLLRLFCLEILGILDSADLGSYFFLFYRGILEILDHDFCYCSGILEILEPKFLFVLEILEILDPD